MVNKRLFAWWPQILIKIYFRIGLANLFQGGGEFLKLYQQNKNETDQMRSSLVGIFQDYINEISADINRISSDWNDSRVHEAQTSALISSFCTYLKRYNLPLKHIGKLDTDKVPTFMSKKFKIKKTPGNSVRGHNFVEFLYTSSKSTCFKCKQSFWGIGNQGLICHSQFTSTFMLFYIKLNV